MNLEAIKAYRAAQAAQRDALNAGDLDHAQQAGLVMHWLTHDDPVAEYEIALDSWVRTVGAPKRLLAVLRSGERRHE